MSDNDMNRFILDKLEKVDDKLEEVRVKYSKLEESFRSHEKVDEEIHNSVRKMATDLGAQFAKVSECLDTYNSLLQDHMRRTEIAEEHLKTLTQKVDPMYEIHKKREIITTYNNTQLKSYVKWAAAISAVGGAIITLAKVFELF